ncbi:response regulator [Sporosarcina sp. CAU 1771]
MKMLLIDSDESALNLLELLLSQMENIQVVGKYTDPRLAYADIEKTKANVIFSDIQLGKIQGLQFADVIMSQFPHLSFVFVTDYTEYAFEAFEVNAFDYLLKPLDQKRLKKTVRNLKEKHLESEHVELIAPKTRRLFARTMGTFHLLDFEQKEVKWRTKKVKELFVYLWHNHKNPLHRTRIIEELWRDTPEDKATTILHTTVYQLRKTLKNVGVEHPVKLINERYVLSVPVDSDIKQLERALETQESTSCIKEIIDLYQGDYLEEENYLWIQFKQQKIKKELLEYLENFISNVQLDPNHQHLLELCYEKMIRLEPYNEKYSYLLLEHYGKTKNKQKMIHFFKEFKEKWLEELGIDIPIEVEEVYKKYIVS